jgi:hypothetical protein
MKLLMQKLKIRSLKIVGLSVVAIGLFALYLLHPNAAQAAFPTNANVIDNFNRADGNLSGSTTSSGATWSTIGINQSSNGLTNAGNEMAEPSSGQQGLLSSTYGPDTEMYVDVTTLPTSGNYVFMTERISGGGTGTWNGYGMIYIKGSPDTWQLRKYTGGVQAVGSPLATGSQSISAGDSIGFSVIGNTLTAWYKPVAGSWISIITATDSTYTGAGQMGFELGDTTLRLDNLSGGNVVTNQPPAAPPSLTSPSNGATGVSTTPQFQMRTTDADNDYLRYKIEVCADSSCSTVVRTIDQTASQTGWSGQDQQAGSAYTGNSLVTSSTLATYDYQVPALSPATQYWWRAYAIDPGGTNSFSAASAILSFTTAAAGSTPSPSPSSPTPSASTPPKNSGLSNNK